jgi:lipopolysaccharide transport system ATP-binding protein
MNAARSAARTGGWFRHLSPTLGDPARWLRLAWKQLTCRVPATVFHVTHYKAGSQWVHRILHNLAEPWVVPPQVDGSQFFRSPVRAGAVYPTLYVTREQFETARLPRYWKRFVVIRDLRDTLVSAYFSLKQSHHRTAHQGVPGFRARLQALPPERALLCMVREWCGPVAAMQRSWVGGPDELLRYEDLLVRDAELFERVLIGHCRLPVSPERLRAVVLANRFEARAGRKPGAEDRGSHERKGVAGDWRNHFTDRVAKAFKDRYGDLLVATGYEKDDRW